MGGELTITEKCNLSSGLRAVCISVHGRFACVSGK